MSKTIKTDILIIGAGVAGLRSACLLGEAGFSVVVCEARKRIGGRTFSTEPATSSSSSSASKERLDFGAQWIGPNQHRALALCERYKIELFEQHCKDSSLLRVREFVFKYSGTIPSLPIMYLLSLQTAIWRIDALARRVPLCAPWKTIDAGLYDHVSVQDWLDKEVYFQDVRSVLIAAIKSVFFENTSEMSFLWFLFYVHSAGGLMSLCDVVGGAQEMRFTNGASSLSECMLRELKSLNNVNVVLDDAVQSVENYEQQAKKHGDDVLVTTKSGKVYQCKQVIGAISPQLCSKIEFKPKCERQYLGTHGMNSGCAIKFFLYYKTAWWRQHKLSGEIVSCRSDDMLHLTYDACTASGNTNALVGFVCGESARLLREQTRDASDPVAARGKWLEQRIVVMSTVDSADVPAALAYRELDWQHEKYTDGCVNSTKPGGWLTRLRGVDDESVEFQPERPFGWSDISRPCGRVLWAGAECAVHWNGYIDGAIESAELASFMALHTLSHVHGIAPNSDKCELVRLNALRETDTRAVTAWPGGVRVADSWCNWIGRLRWPILFYIIYAYANGLAEFPGQQLISRLCLWGAVELATWLLYCFV